MMQDFARRRALHLLLFFATLLFGSISYAQQSAGPVIRLKQGNINMPANAAQWLDNARALPSTEPALVYIHFTRLPDAAEKKHLQDNGITLLEYVPDNTFSAFVTSYAANINLHATSVDAILNVKADWKADNYIWRKTSELKGYTEVLVSFYPGIEATAIRQFIATIGGQITPCPMEKYGSYKVVIAASNIRSIAAWYGVKFISPSGPVQPLDLQARFAVKGNIAVSPVSLGGYGLNGDSVTVGVGDNASAIYHADLKDRVTNFNPAPPANHGEHVNGIIGGAANIDPKAEGLATHASLMDYLFDQILPATGAMYQDHNMTITNNSYAVILNDCGYAGTYDAYSHFIDTLAVQYPEVLHIFASGNDGLNHCGSYPVGFGTVSGGYQPGKNNVVVGSMTDFLGQADDESRGPTQDGRMKPEIVGVGLEQYSTIGVDNYEAAAGTSMACPHVSGGAALLTQRYKQLHGGANPKADVLKAILLNGAMDLGNPGPDYSYGFGAMDLNRSLQILDNNYYTTNSINNGDSQTISISIPANTAQVKVMLCWQDVPASPTAARQLVNDLDLSVIDPSNGRHLPLVSDPTHATNVATEQFDHINNVEQVTITAPVAGTYVIKVKGYSVPFPAQRYVVSYDIMPKGVMLTHPSAGEGWSNNDSMRVYWDAVDTTNTFTIAFSQDNGANWTTLTTSVPGWARFFAWMPAGVNSGNCLVRISENGTAYTSTSGRFVINTIPAIQLDTAQCPGYINIHWSPVPNATAYQALYKKGAFMLTADTVSDTSYIFGNMPQNAKSYVAVRPILSGLGGYRSIAATTVANTGNCLNPISTGDLMVEKILSPASGRMFTSSQLGNNETLSLQIRNLYTAACDSYAIAYNINGAGWQTFTTGPTLAANASQVVNIPGIDLSATGVYSFTATVHNLRVADPLSANDTIRYTVLNIANDTLTLPFSDDFETMGAESVTGHDSIGLSPNGHWDFHTADSAGRIRSFVNTDVTISGNRSISLDENQAVSTGSKNVFTGTFNLADYDTALTEVRLDFDYILHGTPKTASGNMVQARAVDTTAWVPFFTYNLNAYPGFVNHVHSLSVTDVVRNSSKNFSPGTQIAFGQNDTSLIAAPNYGNGITIDNVRLYTVANDAELVQVLSPLPSNCGLPSPQPLTVQVHNGVNYTLHNVQLFYKLDGGAVFSGSIDSITAKATVNYTFAQQMDISSGLTHSINLWLSEAGDTYSANDSILNYRFRNSQIYNSFPYLENFESGDGGYYSDGINNSWQYGTPASAHINKAASGTKAWKTNLTGHYNNLELSYLYSPCFDISSLTTPMLSFSTAQDIENCGNVMCDKAYIEYTFDGSSWTRLGAAGQGTNWYDSAFDVWNTNGFTRWHVASIPLPKPPAGETIHFRFVMNSDPGANFEGIAVDDIHIFDLTYSIFPANGITLAAQSPGATWLDFTSINQVIASADPGMQLLGLFGITLYAHDTLYNPGPTQYTLPRSYKIKTANSASDSVGIRLYLTENELVRTLNDTTCPSCTPVVDAYSLGVTQYNNDADTAIENGTLADDYGSFNYYPYSKINWVPYDAGYYAELRSQHFGEFWFNNGGPTGAVPAGVDYLNLTASKQGNDAHVAWHSLIDTVVTHYILQRSADSINFTDILDTAATHTNPGDYAVNDAGIFMSSSVVYYRLKWAITGNTNYFYSPIRRLSIADSASAPITFDAELQGINSVLASWTSYLDGFTRQYTLERATGNTPYQLINTTAARQHYGQHYTYTDLAGASLAKGTLLHYRLTATLLDNTTIVLPIRTVEWGVNNFVTNVYPNPNNDGNITIAWHAIPGAMMQVNIIDIAGRVRYSASVQATQSNNVTTLQTFHRQKGTYLLRMQLDDKVYTTTVVYE